MKLVVPVAVVVWSISNVACSKPSAQADEAPPKPTVVTAADASVPAVTIRITADDRGFTPATVMMKTGVPMTLVFTRTSTDTCATSVVFPELKITKELPLKTPVPIDVPASKSERTLTFQCGMGMFKGKIMID